MNSRSLRLISVLMAVILLFSGIPFISIAADVAGGDAVVSGSIAPVDEYESEDGATGEIDFINSAAPAEDKDETEIIDQAKVEASLHLTNGLPETASVDNEEEIDGEEEFPSADETVPEDLVPAESFENEPDSFDDAADGGGIQTDFSLVFINASSSSVEVNIGNAAKITFGYIGCNKPVKFIAYADNHNLNGSWGDWNNHKIDLTIVGRSAGKTTLTVKLVDKNENVLATKKIGVTVTNKARFKLTKSADTLYKGKGTSVGMTFSGVTGGMRYGVSVNGSSVSVSWGNWSGSTRYLNVHGTNAGTSRITFYLYSQNGTLLQTDTATVSVVNNPGFGLSETSATVDVGGQKTFLITPYNVIGKFYCEYSLSNGNCTAAWGAWNGSSFPLHVYGKTPGGTTITVKLCAKNGTVLASRAISFTTRENPSISSSRDPVSVQVGSSQNVTLSFKGVNSSVYITTAKSNNNVTTELGRISGSSCTLKISGNACGTSVITAHLRRSNGSIAAACTINVSVVGVPTVSLSPASVSMKVGQQAAVTATAGNITGNYSLAFGVNGNTVTCSWAGNIVNNKATLTVKATKKGNSTVTVYLKNEQGTVVAQQSVTVAIQAADVPKVTAETRSVAVTKGSSVKIKVSIGGCSGDVYLRAQADNDCVTSSWGNWLFNTNTLTVNGQKLGDSVITIKMIRSSDGKELASETIRAGIFEDTSLINSLSYSFDNYSDEIPYSTFVRAFGQNTKSARLYDKQHYAGGLCYGFAVTSMLMQQRTYISPSAFGKSSTWGLKKNNNSGTYNMNVDSFIKWMFITQFSTRKANTISYNLNSLCNYVKNGGIALTCIWGNGGGHAVVAYKLDDVHNRLYIYDSNWPGAVRYITVGKNASGVYTNWSYNLFGDTTWGSNRGGTIGYQTLGAVNNQWINRESLLVYPNWISENLLITNSNEFSVLDIEENIVASYSNGVLNCKENAAYLVDVAGYNPNAESVDDDSSWVIMYLPTAFYTVRNNDTSVDSFHAEMISTELGVSVETDSDEISFGVEDAYDLCSTYISLEAGEEYEVELLSSREGEKNITVNGVGIGEETVLGLALENGVCTCLTDAQASVNIDGAFENGYTVTASADEGGTITHEGANPVLKDGSITFEISPKPCYELEDVLVNGESVGVVREYTFDRVDADASIEAVFAQKHTFSPVTVGATCTENGCAANVCSVCGETENVEILPALGHVDGNEDGLCDRCGVNMTGTEQERCPYCHQTHTGPVAGFVGFFHKIIYFFRHLFGRA